MFPNFESSHIVAKAPAMPKAGPGLMLRLSCMLALLELVQIEIREAEKYVRVIVFGVIVKDRKRCVSCLLIIFLAHKIFCCLEFCLDDCRHGTTLNSNPLPAVNIQDIFFLKPKDVLPPY